MAPHGFDGLNAQKDLDKLMFEEYRRVQSKKLLLISAGGMGFSFFNCLRFGTLSPSGRSAAGGGLVLFSYLTWASLSQSKLLHSNAPVQKE